MGKSPKIDDFRNLPVVGFLQLRTYLLDNGISREFHKNAKIHEESDSGVFVH